MLVVALATVISSVGSFRKYCVCTHNMNMVNQSIFYLHAIEKTSKEVLYHY